MKKTIDVNIGSVAFTMDDDAYRTINSYYDDIRSRLYESEIREVMDDVEARTADVFRDNLSYPAQVVSIDIVQMAMSTIGSADSFGDKRYDVPPGGKPASSQPKRLYRSRTGRMLGGVCGGIAEYFNIDLVWMRIAAVIGAFFSLGIAIPVYVILWMIIPQKPLQSSYFGYSKKERIRANECR